MTRQRSLTRLRPLFLAAAALIGAAALPRPAGAVQIFIESAFVHRVNRFCVVQNSVAGVPRFRCPPLSISVCCPAGVESCDEAAVPPCSDAGWPFEGNRLPSTHPCDPDLDPGICTAADDATGFGNVSNDPEIQFDRQSEAESCAQNLGGTAIGTGPFPRGTLFTNFCNSKIYLCGAVGFGTTDTTADVAIDELSFEIFKFQDGSNPLDEGSTPPLRTFFVDAPGALPGNSTSDASGPLGPFCVLFDGAVNLQGEFGKTNGQFGFRVKTKTNQVGASGNIQITAVRAYPSGATHDADFGTPGCEDFGCVVAQKPIVVDVTNVHVIRSSPTLVGSITAVPAQPYNIFYRLSKDATMYVSVNGSDGARIRSVVNGLPRIGEGTPQGTITNGDSWNGRAENGDFMPPGVFLLNLQAFAQDQFGKDLSESTTRQIALDPLQITDIRVQPLLEGGTSLAVLDYILTEPATAFIDIYPPNTQFCNLENNLNGPLVAQQVEPLPPKDFEPRLGNCAGAVVLPIKRVVEQKNSRTRVISFWDGRDGTGQVVPDGNYVFLIYAALPSQNGIGFPAFTDADRRIWTSVAKSGLIPVIRGFVGISQVTPASSVIGSSPAVAGLNPFIFRYSLSRDALVTLKVFDTQGTRLVKTIVNNEIRQGQFGHSERWDDPVGDDGMIVSSGSYMVQLTATDPAYPSKISTTTALFSINLYRITDVQTQPLLNGASDLALISYQLSQTMYTGLTIYPPGTVIQNSSTTWPPCGNVAPPGNCNTVVGPTGAPAAPILTIKGVRAGRLRITEPWDGRDANGLLVPDGEYVFLLAAESSTTPKYIATDRIAGRITVQRGVVGFPNFTVNPDLPALFNSSATVTLHPFTISYSLTRQSSVTIQVLTTNIPPATVRTIISGQVRQGGLLLQEVWDGRNDTGQFPPSGFYVVRAVATDLATQLVTPSTAQVTIAFDPIRIYDVAVSPLRADTGGSSIFYQVSEPMKIAVKIYKPNTSFDPQGNPSPPESASLVKRIIGVKPARTQIEDVWDGTDLRISMVPDGNYKFKIVGSTDIRAIDDVTGNVLNAAAISLDRPIDEIPVVRNVSIDPQGDFERNTFVYPNPIQGDAATFQIFMPFQGRVKLRVYNIAGELVLDQEFSEQASSLQGSPLSFAWNRNNQAGRRLARGLYYAVIRAEETLGGRNILQTVKKVVIQR